MKKNLPIPIARDEGNLRGTTLFVEHCVCSTTSLNRVYLIVVIHLSCLPELSPTVQSLFAGYMQITRTITRIYFTFAIQRFQSLKLLEF